MREQIVNLDRGHRAAQRRLDDLRVFLAELLDRQLDALATLRKIEYAKDAGCVCDAETGYQFCIEHGGFPA